VIDPEHPRDVIDRLGGADRQFVAEPGGSPDRRIDGGTDKDRRGRLLNGSRKQGEVNQPRRADFQVHILTCPHLSNQG
jgi:hypothetical protein